LDKKSTLGASLQGAVKGKPKSPLCCSSPPSTLDDDELDEWLLLLLLEWLLLLLLEWLLLLLLEWLLLLLLEWLLLLLLDVVDDKLSAGSRSLEH
jgi:hypothetical protein